MKRNKIIFGLVFLVFAYCGCATSSDVFPTLTTELASPTFMWVDEPTNRMYLVNSNSKVSYEWDQGNFQILDITNPLAPTLVKSVSTLSYSGTIYLDLATKKAYMPNRFTATSQVLEDVLYTVSVDESNPSTLLNYTTTPLAKDSFDIECCYPANIAWITTSQNELQYVDLTGNLTPSSQNLLTPLDDGSAIIYVETYHLSRNVNQLFVSRQGGGIMILNLDEVGVSGVDPINYVIVDANQPADLIYDAGKLYYVGQGDEDGTYMNALIVLDVTTLTPYTGGTVAQKIEKDTDGIVVAKVQVGNNPRSLILTSQYIFVSNLNDDTVSVVDRTTYTKVADINVGDEPYALALYQDPVTGADKYIYVGNTAGNTISIIDIATLAVVATYQG